MAIHLKLYLFKDMQRRNNLMDPSTFKSALKACALMGRTDEAYHLFMSMDEVYGIEALEEHCSCMVEALGRAGRFEDAHEFINGMLPVKSGALIWRSLLLSCRVVGNMEAEKYALEKLVELNPSDCSTHVMLKQVLLMLGKWDDASKVRVNLPMIEEEYDGAGLHHTEMKAVAFVLISLPHGMPIRVIKSVRMCGYCHYACKLMSSFIDRKIVIKDPAISTTSEMASAAAELHGNRSPKFITVSILLFDWTRLVSLCKEYR